MHKFTHPDYIGSTLCHSPALFDCIKPMEPFPTIRLTRQEVEHAALELGAKFRPFDNGVIVIFLPGGKLIKHFGAMIVIDDVASADLPPVKQRTSRTFVARSF